jgi:hypothetical protein
MYIVLANIDHQQSERKRERNDRDCMSKYTEKERICFLNSNCTLSSYVYAARLFDPCTKLTREDQ